MLLGGRIGALADVSIRGTYLAFAAILLQLIAFPSDVLPWSTPSSVARILWLVSYALLIWMLHLNIRLRGTPLVAAGLASNLIAIVSNDGLMPVRRAALIAAGRGYHLHNNSIQLGHPHFGALRSSPRRSAVTRRRCRPRSTASPSSRARRRTCRSSTGRCTPSSAS